MELQHPIHDLAFSKFTDMVNLLSLEISHSVSAILAGQKLF